MLTVMYAPTGLQDLGGGKVLIMVGEGHSDRTNLEFITDALSYAGFE